MTSRNQILILLEVDFQKKQKKTGGHNLTQLHISVQTSDQVFQDLNYDFAIQNSTLSYLVQVPLMRWLMLSRRLERLA